MKWFFRRLFSPCLVYICSTTSVATYGVANDSAPLGVTINGTYAGVSVPQLSQEIFRGIPFAYAPRFDLAQSLNESWNDSRPAVEPGLTCAGFGTNNLFGWPVGEDCLNLNIVRPTGVSEGDSLPVLVWIYGGGFRQGSNRDPEFNTSYIVQTSIEIGHPVIVVSINYRLSGYGFLYSTAVMQEGVTNLGLRDQWKALEYIKENIKGFGGDPNRVTVWGESAGAMSISHLTTAYGGDNSNLFQKAIMASGAWLFPYPEGSIAKQASYDNLTASTGCSYAIDTLQCLREVPFDLINTTFHIQETAALGTYVPVVDGDFQRNSPDYAFKHDPPLIAPVDIIIGCNSDEAMGLGVQIPANTSAELSIFIQELIRINTSETDEILALYPEDAQYPPYSEPMTLDWPAITATIGVISGNETRRAYGIFTDMVMMAGRRFGAATWPQIFPDRKAFSYRWDTDPSRFPLVFTAGLGVGFAQHGAELSYEFRLPYVSGSPYPPLPNITAMQEDSYAMQAHWVAFAATGDPNAHGLDWVPDWPAYGVGEGEQKNFVYNATLDNVLNLHVEDDDFRVDGIEWFNQRWSLLMRDI